MRICRKVSRPLLWSAEKPCLYDLRLEVYKEDGSQDGSLQEVVLQKVGWDHVPEREADRLQRCQPP